MRLIKGSLVGLVFAGILAVLPTAAFARGGGGGGGHGGGGHFGGFGGGRHFGGGGGHFGGFVSHGFAPHEGTHFATRGWHRGHYWGGGPYWGWYGDSYPYYGSYDYEDGDYSDAPTSPSAVAPSEQTIFAVQKELAKLGYYRGQIDGIVGPETTKAISWFQSVDTLTVTGRIDDQTLKALQIS
jgi:hypothetical protein